MTPDTKQIAAEIIGIADHIRERFPACASVLKTHAEALDLTPMGIEEAIQVAREWAKTEILGTGPIVDALGVIVAHYEATKRTEKPAEISDNFEFAPARKLVTEVESDEWGAIDEICGATGEGEAIRADTVLFTADSRYARALRRLLSRCVVRP